MKYWWRILWGVRGRVVGRMRVEGSKDFAPKLGYMEGFGV